MRSFLIFALLILGNLLSAAPIRIVGSDLLSPALSDGLKTYAEREERDLSVSLQGSDLGLAQLRKDEADLGLLAFTPGTTIPKEEFVLLPVAYFTAVLAVRNSIPLDQLTYAQIGGIYGDSEQESFRRWRELGVPDPWANRTILAAAISRESSLSFDLLRSKVLQTNRIRQGVVVLTSKAELIKRISTEEGGIAVLPSPPPAQSSVKALSISATPAGVAYPPTPDNINNGDYPLRLPLYLAFPKSKASALNPVLRFLLSEDAVALWERADLVPAPTHARNQLLFSLETM